MVILEKESSLLLSETLKCTKIQSLLNLESLSKKELVEAVRTAILNTARSFKYSESMTPMQAYVLADDLLDKMKYESLEDVLLMLKMGRRGELGSNKGRFDSDVLFTMFLPAYNEIKAAQYEKVNEFIVDDLEDVPMIKEEKEKQQKWLDKLHKLWKADRKPKRPEVFEPVDHHAKFIKDLQQIVNFMTREQLEVELKRAKHSKMWDAYEIYNNELKTR